MPFQGLDVGRPGWPSLLKAKRRDAEAQALDSVKNAESYHDETNSSTSEQAVAEDAACGPEERPGSMTPDVAGADCGARSNVAAGKDNLASKNETPRSRAYQNDDAVQGKTTGASEPNTNGDNHSHTCHSAASQNRSMQQQNCSTQTSSTGQQEQNFDEDQDHSQESNPSEESSASNVDEAAQDGTKAGRKGVEDPHPSKSRFFKNLLVLGRGRSNDSPIPKPLQELKDAADSKIPRLDVLSSQKDKNARKLSPETMQKLMGAQRRTPRFLFRGNTGNSPSGGHQDLNNDHAITPLAYLQKPESEVVSIFDQTEDELKNMLLTHLHTKTPAEDQQPTQFSSWSAKLTCAIDFTLEPGVSNPYVAIIDTKMLQGTNFAAWVPSLEFIDPDCQYYHWEYLVHGPVRGAWYAAIPLRHFRELRVYDDECWQSWPLVPVDDGVEVPECFPEDPKEAAKHTLNTALEVARKYGTHFTLPMFLGMVTKKFNAAFYRGVHDHASKEIEAIVAFVHSMGLKVPIDWCQDDSIMKVGVVETSRYEDVRAMLACMRALVLDRYPEEADARYPGLRKEDVLKNVMSTVRSEEWVPEEGLPEGWRRDSMEFKCAS